MTEHEHTPPITKRGARWLSPGKIMVVINDTAYVMTTREARLLGASIDAALDGPGPDVVCEVIR